MSLTAVEAKKLLMAAEKGQLVNASVVAELQTENDELRDTLRRKEANLRRVRKEFKAFKDGL